MYYSSFSLRCPALLLGLLLAGALASHAQAPGNGGSTGGPPEPQAPNPTEVPLDGGASLLLAGSVAYGLRKLRQRCTKPLSRPV
jgi:hypothetical protein